MSPTSFLDVVLRLALAAGLGGAIGLEREYRQKPAGIRTNMLIGMGSALFAILSVNAAIGMAAGLGLYTVAAGGATLTLVVLALLPLMERLFEERGGSDDLS